MKKILLTLAVIATTFSAVEAQSKKSPKKKAAPKASGETKLKADIAKIKEEKRMKNDSLSIVHLQADSIRKEDERMAEEVKATERAEWKEKKLRETDSSSKAKWAMESAAKDDRYATNRSQDAMNKAAQLNDMQGRQVKAINQTYLAKARAIKDDVTIEGVVKSTQLAALNTQRREEIKAVVGANKDKALEKERVKMVATNNDAAAFKLFDEMAPIAIKQK